ITNPAGVVLERYVYYPYGKATRYDAGWANPGDPGTGPYAWLYLHQGGRYDTTSGLYHVRNREFSPTLGRWMQVDPIGHESGTYNLYEYESNRPTSAADPYGQDDKPVDLKLEYYAGKEGGKHKWSDKFQWVVYIDNVKLIIGDPIAVTWKVEGD